MMRKSTKRRLTPQQLRLRRVLDAEAHWPNSRGRCHELPAKPVDWPTVYNWIQRGSVPKRMLLHVQKVTRAPLKDLI